MNNPLEQFEIHKIVEISIFGYDLSFTNSSMVMLIGSILACGLFAYCVKNIAIIPSKAQMFGELIYNAINQTLINSAGAKAQKYIPLIFSLFIFILFCNILGLFPHSFAPTSHIAITFSLAIVVFLFITLAGIVKHGFKFFSLFLPAGIPLWLAPLMIIIELFSYLGKPISLSLRLAANMVAGHILLEVLAGFMVMLPLVLKVLPMPLIMILLVFEFGVAILQAYIFTILSCVYLNDTLNLH
ncbi:F0F1 ATP synthase subunit A [Candidatus Phycorickettsia trachydisci]|uniref:ATP synthase subunit a n=2 Tax=Candidatus Phycorickettsia trachydisci TaxID=2115978 RepID=A0A2P1P7T8_9RICK|nr:F0F1 ATP synthase subunit A [Candidatus Phycorickettsia trachydisci]